MLALASKFRSYPTFVPDRRPQVRASTSRRAGRRRNPIARTLILAAVVFLPAVAYVSQRTEAARSGYAILRLHAEVSALQSDNARLLASVTALKSPDRIEQIAVGDLGMVPPKQQQLAALTLPPMALATLDVPMLSFWHQLASWLIGGEAQAQESR